MRTADDHRAFDLGILFAGDEIADAPFDVRRVRIEPVAAKNGGRFAG